MPARSPIALGTIFGRLTVISEAPSDEKYKKGDSRFYRVSVKCSCGTTKVVPEFDLRNGKVKSCGCLNVDAHSTHRLSKTATYRIWAGILTRCRNEKDKSFQHYGAKGITVCDWWLKFENFLADMGEKPRGKTIDRKNNKLGYDPSNCRWATFQEQAINRSTTQFVVLNGETIHVSKAANLLGIDKGNLGAIAKREGSYQAAVKYVKTSKRRGPYKKKAA